MQDYFFLDEQWGTVESGRVDPDGRTIVLTLPAPSGAARIGYLPNLNYLAPPWITYEGPWIRNPRGVGARSFWGIPIEESADIGEAPPRPGTTLRIMGCSPNPGDHGVRIDFSRGARRRPAPE